VHHEHPEPPSRRTILDWAVHGIGAIFTVIFGAPAIAYLIDPRNRPSPPGDFRPVAGVKLSEVGEAPVQGAIRNVRRDAWTLYPNDVIGRVWIHRVRPGTAKECFQVFSTVCPHLGCSINSNADQGITTASPDSTFLRTGSKPLPTPHAFGRSARDRTRLARAIGRTDYAAMRLAR